MRMLPRWILASLGLALGIAWAPVALAGDGVVELNHTAALAGSINGSAASDPAGYPVVITASGSYVLTGDLTPPPDTTAVAINTANVTIDLNGFAIRGANTCSATGLNVTCTAADRGRGVDTIGCLPGVHVHDGRVVGMGSTGLELCGNQSRVERVDVSMNAGKGIHAGFGAAISACIARLNGSDGIHVADGSVVRDNVAEQNGNDGVRASANSVIVSNNASRNEQTGISANLPTFAGASVVRDNSSNGNGAYGIDVAGGTVAGNTTEGNSVCGIRGSSTKAVATDNVVINNPAGCSGASCCSLSGIRRLGCNLETLGTIAGTFINRCCSVPGAADSCVF